MVIHCRNAFEQLIAALEKWKGTHLRGVVHCFTGSIEEAKHLIQLGFYLGIGGIVTYKNAGLAEVVRQLPLDAILLETDAPYLAPAPKRGKCNEPSFLPYIAGKIAELQGVEVEKVAQVTTRNAQALFGAPKSDK